MKSLELKIPPLALVLIAAALMWWLQGFYPLAALSGRVGHLLALLSALCGMAVAVAGVIEFRRACTTLDPTNPAKACQVVSSGIFARTRNPMYLGFVLLLLGLCFWLADLTAFLMLAVFVRYLVRYQIEPEERLLLQKFGAEFESYTQQVRRWL